MLKTEQEPKCEHKRVTKSRRPSEIAFGLNMYTHCAACSELLDYTFYHMPPADYEKQKGN